MSVHVAESSEQTSSQNTAAPPSLSDHLSKQVQELNKKLLASKQEREQYLSDIQSIKQLLCQDMRIAYDEKMSISELKARFRGYRRREEEAEEARFVEHNRNVSELFATVKQNMKIYEKKIDDAVSMVVELGQKENPLSEENIDRIHEVLNSLASQKEKFLEIDTQLLNYDKDINVAELTETNKKLRERIHILESIQTAIRSEGSSIRHEEEVDLCALQQELAQKNMEIEHLQKQISHLDAELGESERIREQQHQQLLLLSHCEPVSVNADDDQLVSSIDSLRLQLQRLREDQKQAGIDIIELKNQKSSLQKQVQENEEELAVIRERYSQCNEEYTKMKEKYDEIEKNASHIIQLIEENNRTHEEEIEKIFATIKQDKTSSIVDQLKEYNYFYRQKEYNMNLAAYQRMEEFLMNRIRQLSNQINRGNALVTEKLSMKETIEITPDIAKKMTKAQICEMKEEMPVVNMAYLRELILKFISFPRGSSERTFLYPVLKTLLSLGEREMRILRGDMSYKPPSVIPLDRPLVKDNQYIDSSTLLSQIRQ